MHADNYYLNILSTFLIVPLPQFLLQDYFSKLGQALQIYLLNYKT